MGIYEESLTAFRSGDTELAEDLALELLGESRSAEEEGEGAGDRAGRVDALCMLARVALRRGDLYRATTLADDAWGVSLGAVNRREEVMLKRMPIHLMGAAARMRGEYAGARMFYLESIELNRELGEEGMVAAEHRNLGYVELHDGHVSRARELFAIASKNGALEPYVVLDAAALALEDGDVRTARELAAKFAAAGLILDPDDAAELEALQARLRGGLAIR
jgi:hypothetical protein